ncbi:hypothetical protein CLV42_10432 [Chitinophaga ginsengisoli]|uniref:Uncharacterized protein n=1 Tax=Chitinophaga ginsengisoli TaxID=363837 RepID=A0A2P8GCN3_9BACT|nr:hypothetical protein CLV42_10432 [Chitinophaga ginsengisoli]
MFPVQTRKKPIDNFPHPLEFPAILLLYCADGPYCVPLDTKYIIPNVVKRSHKGSVMVFLELYP